MKDLDDLHEGTSSLFRALARENIKKYKKVTDLLTDSEPFPRELMERGQELTKDVEIESDESRDIKISYLTDNGFKMYMVKSNPHIENYDLRSWEMYKRFDDGDICFFSLRENNRIFTDETSFDDFKRYVDAHKTPTKGK